MTKKQEMPSVLQDGFEAFIHWKTLLMITIFALLVSIHSAHGFITIDGQTLAITIFSISGTMVALVLPAAELAHGFVEKLDELLVDIIQHRGDPQRKFQSVNSMIAELKSNLYPAWRASVYALVSFVLSILGILLPNWMVPLSRGLFLAVDELVIISSLAFLVSAALWFFPSARYAFRLHILDEIKETMKEITDFQKQIKTTEAQEVQPPT